MAMLLGLANGNVPRNPEGFSADLIEGWARQGIRCLATSFAQPHEVVKAAAPRLRERLADSGIHVAQYAGVNANFVHTDPEVRRAGRESVRVAIGAAHALGATMISSGCGTNSDDYVANFYAPHPLNYSVAARDRLVAELREIAPIVEDAGLLYTIECHQLSVMRSPEVIRDVLDEVDSPVVVANFDPVNLLDSAVAVFDNARRMQEMADVVGPRYGPSCHIKDVLLSTDFVCRIIEVPPGDGVLDYPAFFEAASRLPGPTPLIVEHLDPSRSIEGIRYVRESALACGVELL